MWLFTAVLVSFIFLLPAAMLLQTAGKSSARAAHAARHGLIQLDNEEGALLFQAMQIQRGESIYRSLEKPPYVAGTYTPLYMAMVAAWDDFDTPGFSKGRILVWSSALGISCLLILLVAGATRNAPLGILAGIGFLATFEVYRWIGYFRVDFPALFFSLAGLTIIVIGNARRLPLIVGALLMVLALYTKQTMIAAPMACFLALLIRLEGRRFLFFALALLVFGLPPLVILHIMTEGQFLRHIIIYNMNTFSRNDLIIWATHLWNIHRGLVFAGAMVLPWLLWIVLKDVRRSGETEEVLPSIGFGFWQPLIIYGIFAQWNIFGAAKAGSAENYLLEPIAGLLILACLAAGSAIRWVAVQRFTIGSHLMAAVTIIVVLTGFFVEARMTTSEFAQERLFSPYINPTAPDFSAAQTVRTMVRKAEHPLTELAIFALQADRKPIFQPFIMSELARQGRWDQSKFVADITEAKFDLIVAQQDLTQLQAPIEYTEQMMAAFREAYQLEETVSGPLWTYYMLRPKLDKHGGETPISDIASVR